MSDLLEETPDQSGQILEKLKKQERMLKYVVSILCIINGILTALPHKMNSVGFTIGSILGIFCGALLSGLLFGSLLAFIPYKRLPYRRKFKIAALFAALLMSIFLLIILSFENNFIRIPGK